MRFQFPGSRHYRTLASADVLGKQQEATINKIIITLMAIYFPGDLHLQNPSWLGDLKIYTAAAIALVSMPWITSQIDV